MNDNKVYEGELKEEHKNQDCTLIVFSQLFGVVDINSSEWESYLNDIEKMAQERFPNKVRCITDTMFFPKPSNEQLAENGMVDIDQETLDCKLFEMALSDAVSRYPDVCMKLFQEFFDVLGVLPKEEDGIEAILERLGIS